MNKEYYEYLNSDDWKKRRKELLKEASWKCSECGKRATQIHHDSYDNLGNEQLNVDVRALCTECHNEEHGYGAYGEYNGGYGSYGEW